MLKIIIALFCAVGCGYCGIVTTYSGSCTVKDSGGNVVGTASAPDDCAGIVPGLAPHIGASSPISSSVDAVTGTSIGLLIGAAVSAYPTSVVPGYSFTGFFEVSYSYDVYLTVPYGTGTGTLQGTYSYGADGFNDAFGIAGPPVVDNLSPHGTFNTFSIPFTFGVPIHIQWGAGAFISYSGTNFYLRTSTGDASIMLTMQAYDANGNPVVAPTPELPTWLLFAYGAAVAIAVWPCCIARNADKQRAVEALSHGVLVKTN
jgi:hypothetical protein